MLKPINGVIYPTHYQIFKKKRYINDEIILLQKNDIEIE